MATRRDEDLTPWLVAAVKPIVHEMMDRLDADLSEPDLIAVATAVQKAMIAGARHGVAVLAGQEGGPTVTWTGDDYDEWTERFGQAA